MTQYQPPNVINYMTPTLPANKRGRRVLAWVLVTGLVIILFLLFIGRSANGGQRSVAFSEFTAEFLGHNVQWIDLSEDEIQGRFINAPAGQNLRFRTFLPQGMGNNWEFMHWMIEHRGQAEIRVAPNANVLVPLIPWLLIFAFIWFFVFRQLRRRRDPNEPPIRVTIVNAPLGGTT